jgi:DNA polymerase III subunit delta'
MAKKVKAKAVSSETTAQAFLPGPILSHIKGHEQQVQALTEAIVRNRLPQTLLFVGPSGIGKKHVALGIAQVLVCEKRKPTEKNACGECGHCIRMAKQSSEDLLLIEPQGATIKIEQAHEILRFISLRQLGRARLILINEAHLLGPQAGNALLKSLEEPPPNTYFILVTPNSGAILTTIRSRSQTIRFQSLNDKILSELTGADEWMIKSAQGSLEALSRLNQNRDEWDHLRRSAITSLEAMVSGLHGTDENFRDSIKDRPSALFVIQTWLRALRDFTVVASNAGKLNKDQLLLPDHAKLIREGANLPLTYLEQLGTLCLELEQDINRNVDRSLAFENFAIAVRNAYAGREPRPVLLS